jgi:hypothetical protein
VLERVSFTQMLIVPRHGGITLQLAITLDKPGSRRFEFPAASRPGFCMRPGTFVRCVRMNRAPRWIRRRRCKPAVPRCCLRRSCGV